MATITVMEWQRTLLFTDGRFTRVLGPGRHRYRRRRVTLHTVDVRPRATAVQGQDVLTADGVTLKLSALAHWRIADPHAYLTGAAAADLRLYSAVQLAVRDAVAAVTFDEVLADRSRLSAGLVEAASPALDGLGIELTSAVVKDLMLPGELRRAATETLLARENGRAELERARAEAAALRTLANAARLLEQHPALLRLRTIQAAAAPGATVVLNPDPHSAVPHG
ncbi:slipin family protein [Couchioplanes azureus]|uniref:slipin family protein n=1 Tax=Couchioplanes caeruleus TaxID=56438 RepID=UPI001E4362F3|nr:slipin family protein [Couchioplanes caeruleus]